MVEYYIRGDCNHSDHLPLWGKVLLQVEAWRRKSSFKMSSYYLDDEEVRVGIRRIWLANPTLGFTGNLRRATKFYKEFCIRKAKERRQIEADLRHNLADAVAALQDDPSNVQI
jgi:hypothetical protein